MNVPYQGFVVKIIDSTVNATKFMTRIYSDTSVCASRIVKLSYSQICSKLIIFNKTKFI